MGCEEHRESECDDELFHDNIPLCSGTKNIIDAMDRDSIFRWNGK
jgi:hypothetical protein